MSAYEQGFDLFKQQPDLTLGEVAWLGPKTLNEAFDFLEGYKAARRQHDDYKREQTEQMTFRRRTASGNIEED